MMERENQTKVYIAITIGPIGTTMSAVTKPAELWASSYFFSFISRTICEKLMEDDQLLEHDQWCESGDIITPYYDKNSQTYSTDGVGKYPDHIIFCAKKFDVQFDMMKLRETVLKRTAEAFDIDKNFIESYVMMKAVEFDPYTEIKAVEFDPYTEIKAEKKKEIIFNPILASALQLDNLELPIQFITENKGRNPLLNMFNNEDERSNERIKRLADNNLGVNLSEWQLLKNGNIRSLAQIAGYVSNTRKSSSYFAVIEADGDNFGKIISNLGDDPDLKEFSDQDKEEKIRGKIRDFSKTCIEYCDEVSKVVGNYGGMTIYAGGDDLLALVPCDTTRNNAETGNTVFNLIKSINTVFQSKFENYIDDIKKRNEGKEEQDRQPLPSLSYGVLVCYEKYPLYEALGEAGSLLSTAKGINLKNTINLKVIKHAGQTMKVIIPNSCLEDIIQLQNEVFKLANIVKKNVKKDAEPNADPSAVTGAESNTEPNTETAQQLLLSVLYHIENQKALFNLAGNRSEDGIRTFFKNTFDAQFHDANTFIRETLPSYYKKLTGVIYDQKSTPGHSVDAFIALLRILKFYVEKKGERE